MRIPSRLLAAVGLVAAGFFSPGCAGGGGGGDPPAAPAIPGSLVGFAIEGGFTPAGGVYGPFIPDMLLSAAEGGWVAFVADIIGHPTPGVTKGLFVVQPNGTVVSIYQRNEPIPSNIAGTGVIDQFRRIWMRPGGIVVADVDFASGTRPRGIVTARADGTGGVVEKNGAFYVGNPLPPHGPLFVPSGNLDDINENLTEVSDIGVVFIVGSTDTGLDGVFAADRAGGGPSAIAVSSDSAGSGDTFGHAFTALAVTQTGASFFAFACDVVSGFRTRAIYVVDAGHVYARVVDDSMIAPNSPPASPRQFSEVYDGRRLIFSWAGGAQPGFLVWRGRVIGAAPNHGVYRCQVIFNGALGLSNVFPVIGAAEPLNGVGAGASASDVNVFDQEVNSNQCVFRTDIAGGSTSLVFARLINASGAFSELWRQGTNAPGGSTFNTSYPSLSTVEHNDAVDRVGGFACSAVLGDSSSGVFWDIPANGRYAVAKQTGAAPNSGGALFGAFTTPSAVSTAAGNLAFRAALVGGSGASGLFRQN